MGRSDDTVALISGGARGIGASHVRGLVAEGAKVGQATISACGASKWVSSA